MRFQQYALQNLNHYDSLILSLTDDDIKNLSKDSCSNLYNMQKIYNDDYDKYDDELDEMLKINPVYSDYPEIKNQKYHFTIENRLPAEVHSKIRNNADKLYKKAYDLDF